MSAYAVEHRDTVSNATSISIAEANQTSNIDIEKVLMLQQTRVVSIHRCLFIRFNRASFGVLALSAQADGRFRQRSFLQIVAKLFNKKTSLLHFIRSGALVVVTQQRRDKGRPSNCLVKVQLSTAVILFPGSSSWCQSLVSHYSITYAEHECCHCSTAS